MTVPLYCRRCCSSHWTDSASRWLVGSSSNRMSGSWISSRQSATRRFSPPDSTSTWVSGGGHRRASMAISSWFSSSAVNRLDLYLQAALLLQQLLHLIRRKLLAEPVADRHILA